ncbi:MAG: polysaccharide deacetylase family protein [Candidatus Delongbacteria bacterium]|nr:polysaccharide deacetylase family protein [Candidatus Delongbacteria bacterium]
MDFLYNPPAFVKSFFPGIIWQNDSDGVLVTVDDGPSEYTYRILDSLDRHGIKAIFFCTGRNIEKNFHEFNAILKAGHKIESHGFDHKRMILRDKKYNLKQIEKSNEVIRQFTGKEPHLFRPPYGLFNFHTLNAVKTHNMKMMLWTMLTGDHTGDFATVRRLTDSYLTENSIIVLHDNKKSSVIFDQSLEHIKKVVSDRQWSFTSQFQQ